jgi:hypothetical protein
MGGFAADRRADFVRSTAARQSACAARGLEARGHRVAMSPRGDLDEDFTRGIEHEKRGVLDPEKGPVQREAPFALEPRDLGKAAEIGERLLDRFLRQEIGAADVLQRGAQSPRRRREQRQPTPQRILCACGGSKASAPAETKARTPPQLAWPSTTMLFTFSAVTP